MILQQYKIVFAGTMGAGKTAAIEAISEIPVLNTEAVNTDVEANRKLSTTVGIDYGEILLDENTKIGLYGTPGQQRFKFIWEMICKGTLGIILLINHSEKDPVSLLDEYIQVFSNMTNNIVIGITHLDEKSKLNTTMYREWEEKQPTSYPLFFLDARVKNDVLFLVETLIAKAEIEES